VDGYLRTFMGRSLQTPTGEPDGSYQHAQSNTRFLVRSNQYGLFQRMQYGGQNSDYRIDYVIGSGSHAVCYLARVGDHLFESPICKYPGRGYAIAPGYENNPAPGFTRPITVECLLCHSDKPLPIPGSLNRYQSPAFAEEAISCDRCHGDRAAHLKRPVPGSIVNPAKLAPHQRDSVCERCHLAGTIRVLNPGRSLSDFHPGQTLESAFTTYVATAANGSAPLRVISQSEQLADSQCSRSSKGQMWCATCHDPHNQPRDPVAYFRQRCLDCHQSAFPSDHPSRASNCLPCHMPQREAQDGGHTAFTDHRIQRRPRKEDGDVPIANLRAWREPSPELRTRNKALALNDAGKRYAASALLAQSYPLLLQAEKTFPNDPDVLAAIGSALLDRNEPMEAAKFFDHALEIRHDDPSIEDNSGSAWLAAGDKQTAARHFEQALKLDPLLLPDIEALRGIYRELGEHAQEDALMRRVQEAMKTGPAPAPKR
jgi:hypothetical protein